MTSGAGLPRRTGAMSPQWHNRVAIGPRRPPHHGLPATIALRVFL